MKQKNYKGLLGVVLILAVVGILYIALHDISPVSHHVEKTVETSVGK
jgi:hypothetical protein